MKVFEKGRGGGGIEIGKGDEYVDGFYVYTSLGETGGWKWVGVGAMEVGVFPIIA